MNTKTKNLKTPIGVVRIVVQTARAPAARGRSGAAPRDSLRAPGGPAATSSGRTTIGRSGPATGRNDKRGK